ncbi:hypothetical protein DFA_12096 [Cavenderia fasciculata]|uniref:Uncharacterized protein n=1 Tax=Cavenderia fasciculata TaxID=261658 RepID=F4QFS9_CACFS|nr:uncharacterized protein DFA_12096 [Cavenderia fasciculata]EGG14326.1 hypothetical protein DFA_12096 [Cavenderia fasciculata]|eukprot:XP_004351035.1 hypothetical protein DFA_12096 [Cavenderia fasciculata]
MGLFNLSRSKSIRFLRNFQKFNYVIYGVSMTATCVLLYKETREHKENFINQYADAAEEDTTTKSQPATTAQ